MATLEILPKNDNNCSLVYLIDENFCLGDSLQIINNNVESLSASLLTLENESQIWNEIYSFFSTNTSSWFSNAEIIPFYNELWMNTYSLVQKLSASWNKMFTMYYPTVLSYDEWYGIKTTPKWSLYNSSVIPTWLKGILPPRDFLPGQEVNVFIYLYWTESFSIDYTGAYGEPCLPYTLDPQNNFNTVEIQCPGLCPQVQGAGCNGASARTYYENGVQLYFPGGCTSNVLIGCDKNSGGAKAFFTCSSSGGTTLSLRHTFTDTDTFITRIVQLKYRSNGLEWIPQAYNL
jgi:hypothetical protein